MKNCVLNAVQFKNNLKLITISHYMRTVSCSSYNEDDRKFLPDFLETVCNLKKKSIEIDIPNIPNVQHHSIVLNNIQINILHHVAGYLITSIRKNEKCCRQCISCTGNLKPNLSSYNKLTFLRCYGDNTLFFVNQRTLNFFIEMERIFRAFMSHMKSYSNVNLRNLFISKFEAISFFLPECHQLKKKIIRRFTVFRLKIYSKKESKVGINYTYASKTMAMHIRTK